MPMPVLSVGPASCISRRFEPALPNSATNAPPLDRQNNKKGRNPRAGIPAFAVGG